jgi:hypothetical protein
VKYELKIKLIIAMLRSKYLYRLVLKYSKQIKKMMNCEYVNGDELFELDLKVISKIMKTSVHCCSISEDFTEIACFREHGKIKFLKMRKYLKAKPEDELICKLANFYNVSR